MKTESTALSRQRETICHEEKDRREGPWIFFWIFCYCSQVFVHWFRLHSYASRVRHFFRAHPIMGTTNNGRFHFSVSRLQLTVFTQSRPSSSSVSTTSHSLNSAWCWMEEHIHFRWFCTCAKDLGRTIVFLVIFNYHSNTTVISWPNTSAFPRLLSLLFHRLSVCVFL